MPGPIGIQKGKLTFNAGAECFPLGYKHSIVVLRW